MDLVLFDLDNTLLAGDSDYQWAAFLITKGVLDPEKQKAKNITFYEQYQNGTLDIDEFLEFQLAPLAQHPRTQLNYWHQEFLDTVIRPIITTKARALIAEHARTDALMAVVTATNSFVTGPIARELGIPHLIATIAAHENGHFTGACRGIPAFQAGKVTRVENWLEAQGLYMGSFERSWFYSDSHNDLPLLSHVTHPVAVDPDDRLHTHALQQGWPIISLRE